MQKVVYQIGESNILRVFATKKNPHVSVTRKSLGSHEGSVWGRWLHEVRNLMISLPTPFNPMYYQTASV